MNRATMAARAATLSLLLAATAPATAREGDALERRVQAVLAKAAPGTRFGLVVTGEDGREIVAINPDMRFIPASNTKIFTTAAAMATLTGLDRPDEAGGTAVRLDSEGRRIPDVILEGNGDARLSSAADCTVDCLATLADAVAARTRRVHDIIGDDTLFPDERWSPGMSWNNIQTRSGTGISALSLDHNEVVLKVAPAAVGQPPSIETLPYYRIDNRAVTVASGATNLQQDRMPFSDLVRLTGTIAASAQPETVRLGIDDPAHYAAWRFRTLLEERGVKVTGAVSARHRRLARSDDPALRAGAPPPRPPRPAALARLVPPPLAEDIVTINKISQNLHSELLLRRVGLLRGTGSIADGLLAVRTMLEQASVPRTAWELSDGSGMSSYNRVAPRGMVALLRWIAAQPWGSTYRASLPSGGEGTLRTRFGSGLLAGRLSAKTGTLNATSALSGYMTGKSGRGLTFSFYANDVPDGSSAPRIMDEALELIAAEN